MNRTYACTDFHGRYEIWKQIRDYCDKTDTIYFLGDAIDRGPAGIKIMMEMLADPRVIYIRGNHEQLMLNALTIKNSPNITLWIFNGGSETEQEWNNLKEEQQKKLLEQLKSLPYIKDYRNQNNDTIFLTHAGFTIGLLPNNDNELLWDRHHMLHSYWADKDSAEAAWQNKCYVVHGHTPVPAYYDKLRAYHNVKSSNLEIAQYCEGHKFNLDLATFKSGKAALFDLDTFETKYFYDEVF